MGKDKEAVVLSINRNDFEDGVLFELDWSVTRLLTCGAGGMESMGG